MDTLLALHANLVEDLRLADALKLIDAGIGIDAARLHVERRIAELQLVAADSVASVAPAMAAN